MRKIVCLLLGILATLTICGCGKKSSYYVNQDGISLEKADYSFLQAGMICLQVRVMYKGR